MDDDGIDEIDTNAETDTGDDIDTLSNDIIALDDTERKLLSEAFDLLRKKGSGELAMVERRFSDLENLAEAVSRFPSIHEVHMLGGVMRGPETLASALCELTGDTRLLRTPTRVVAGRSFLVAKVHALSLAAMSLAFDPEFAGRLRSLVLSIVFSLMAEDVYLDCLEDRFFPMSKKAALAGDLILLWDQRRDPRALTHVPALSALWAVRDEQIPVFGTMEGASELVRLSFDLDSTWNTFISSGLENHETLLALEELLFGLSFEEIRLVRDRLTISGEGAADKELIGGILGGKSHYTPVEGTDPRAMYEFYAQRRDAARARSRVGAPGPLHTLEELYLSYLMAR